VVVRDGVGARRVVVAAGFTNVGAGAVAEGCTGAVVFLDLVRVGAGFGVVEGTAFAASNSFNGKRIRPGSFCAGSVVDALVLVVLFARFMN
jgi:hypothetical protein